MSDIDFTNTTVISAGQTLSWEKLGKLTPAELAENYSVYARFGGIQSLLRLLSSAEKQHSSHKHPMPPQEKAGHYEGLNKLVGSFSHSAKYYAFIENAIDLTVERVSRDAALMHFLQADTITVSNAKKRCARMIYHFMGAASTLAEKEFSLPPLRFFCTAASENGQILQGVFAFSREYDSKGIGAININEHVDAHFYDPIESSATTVHEAIHGVECQAAHKNIYDNVIGRQVHLSDRALFELRLAYNATVPYTYDRPYRNQYHERLAYDLERRFIKGLKAIM